MSHEDYLKRVLDSKKLELQELNINHRITIAKYETKKETLYEQIDSIEKQLEEVSQ